MNIDNKGLTDKDVIAYLDSLSNWGKWGPGDQIGALNYITSEKRAAAGALIQSGEVVSISLPVNTTPSPLNPRPASHIMMQTGESPGATGSMDYIGVAYHGLAHSHIDALCHIFYQGKMYNGYPSAEVKSNGAHRNSIGNVKDKVVGRGVLLDIPALKGRDWLEPGEAIYVEDLEAAEKRQGVTVGEGDILLVRTGRHKRARAVGYPPDPDLRSGLHASALPWVHERHVAVLGSDGVTDVKPSGFDTIGQPYHLVAIVALGVHLLDNNDFEAIAEACGRHNRYEFFFVIAPLFIELGTGSPANGLAIF